MISWVVTQRGPTYPSMFCAVSVFFTSVLDSLLLGHDMSVGRYAYHWIGLGRIKLYFKKERNIYTHEDWAVCILVMQRPGVSLMTIK
jgi:hypothetical protein